MKQQVEIFYNEDCEDIIAAMNNGEDIVSLMDKLGLKKQKGLYEVNNRPIPYRRLKSDENFVYRVLCPNSCPIEDYEDEVIPLECFKEIKRAQESKYFKHLTVWYAEAATIKDPVIIGEKTNSNGYSIDLYIIARWGAELLPIEVLLPEAIAKYKAVVKAKIARIQGEIDSYLREIEAVDEHCLPSSVSLNPCLLK